MKKIYLSICAIVIVSTSLAQHSKISNDNSIELTKQISNVHPQVISSSALIPIIIWENTCSDVSDWTLTNSGVPPLDWNFSTNIDIQSQCVTPLPSSLQTFNSTTASDGFMIINSDAAPGNADGNGTPIVAEFTNDIPIDLTGYPYVELSFQHSFRWWNDTRGVRVSGDNGVTWTDFEISNATEYHTPDQNSDNPHISTYNISSIAGNSDSVLVQFYYNDNDFWGWYWNIDDVKISEMPDNAASISDAVQGGWWVNYVNVASGALAGFDFTFQTPSQLSVNPYSFEAVLHNNGVGAQNMVLNAEVFNDQGTSVFTSSSSSMLLDMSHSVDTFACNNTFTPTANGAYEMRLWGTGDSVVTDTAVLVSSIVNDYIYGRDWDQAAGTWRVARDCGGMVLGTTLDIYANETVYALQVHIDAESVVGTPLFVALYENGTEDPIYLTQSEDYTLSSNDIGNWITVPFDGGEDLFAGTSYLAAVGGYASPVDTFKVSVSGESQSGCYIQDNGCDLNSANPIGTWYSISEIPMIRMTFDPAALSTDNVMSGEFNIYPNPNNGIFTVELNNIKADDYRISVTNVLGQEVYTSTKEVSILISEKIDLSDLSKGIYMLEVSNSESSITEKIIVE